MKKVRVIKRDMQNRPRQAAVGSDSTPIEIVVERWGSEWQPVYAIRYQDRIDLPRGFELNRDALAALDAAL